VVLFYKHGDPPIREDIGNVLEFQHPLFAVLLSLFNGEKPFYQVIDEFAYISGMTRESVLPLASQLVENKNEIKIDFNGQPFFFPKNTLIPLTEKNKNDVFHYDPTDFLIPDRQLDFTSRRFYSPMDASFILNNICVTHCVYCFTDQRRPESCRIPFERMKELIREARDIGMRAINLSGGEVFTYKYWRELLKELVDKGFSPFIPTKYPLNRRKIEELKDIGINRIQLSIDTVKKDEMRKLLRVHEDYHGLILKTLEELDKHGFEIQVNGQITSINQDSMKEYFDYLLKFENVRMIRVRPTGYSMYPKGPDYREIRPQKKKLDHIKELVHKQREKHGERVRLIYYTPKDKDDFQSSAAEKQKRFRHRALCSGNFFAFNVLPDGRVTICEELYAPPQLIIGNLMTQSIREVWNSERALSLYRLTRDAVSEQSACKTCADFDHCHQVKSICWKMVVYAYGEEKWDFPDPRCPHAPGEMNPFWLDSGD
jgi:radical SAM protein with 4Fe4S-binding SPASM domain